MWTGREGDASMATFLFIGGCWINVDKITTVDVMSETASGNEYARVSFGATGGARDIKGESYATLMEFLKQNSAVTGLPAAMQRAMHNT
jgi:hypothetical protein